MVIIQTKEVVEILVELHGHPVGVFFKFFVLLKQHIGFLLLE